MVNVFPSKLQYIKECVRFPRHMAPCCAQIWNVICFGEAVDMHKCLLGWVENYILKRHKMDWMEERQIFWIDAFCHFLLTDDVRMHTYTYKHSPQKLHPVLTLGEAASAWPLNFHSLMLIVLPVKVLQLRCGNSMGKNAKFLCRLLQPHADTHKHIRLHSHMGTADFAQNVSLLVFSSPFSDTNKDSVHASHILVLGRNMIRHDTKYSAQ